MDEIQSNEKEIIRFSLTEASICASMLDFHFFGTKNSRELELFYDIMQFQNKEEEIINRSEFEWIVELCIKQSNKGGKK